MATTKLRPIKELNLAKYNPASRLKDISGLAASIEEVGLLVPVLITDKDEVVDGHRRIAAYKKLKLTDIETITVKGEAAAMYAHVNAQNKKLSGNENLNVYLSNPMAVFAKTRAGMVSAEEAIGRPLMERLAREGLSLATVRLARTIANMADRTNPDMVKRIVKWLLHFGNTGVVKKALEAGTSPGIIIAAVERNKAIRPTFGVK